MAGHELIDAYLVGLRTRLAWCPDLDDVLVDPTWRLAASSSCARSAWMPRGSATPRSDHHTSHASVEAAG